MSRWPLSDRERLNASFVENEGCWLWQKGKTERGYGRMHFRGKNWKAHRVAYTLFVGEIPEGMTVDHLCMAPACVNPAHFRLLSLSANMRLSNRRCLAFSTRTHCDKGHPFSGDNLYRSKEGARVCKACRNEYAQKYRQSERVRAWQAEYHRRPHVVEAKRERDRRRDRRIKCTGATNV
jgi:hypothetical protein